MNTVEQRVEELVNQLSLKEKVSLLSGKDIWNTVPIERLGIPAITMTDGPHGVRASRAEAGRPAGHTTAFPTGVSMAASWNAELVEKVGVALAEETRGMGCDILLGPCVNIVRHPLAGRNFESFAEDPYLAGRIGVAYVRGLQSRNIGASLKHFACNNQEVERFRGSSEVDERTLREIYLSQFEAVVKETQPWTVMCSYNRINGVYASQHDYLLNEILRKEWGFAGAVISDWGANHTTVESVQGGLDLEMPGPAKYYGDLLFEAASIWQIEESMIDAAVRRILTLVIRSGKMDGVDSLPAGAVNTREHQALAREVAEEAITLLKNEGGLLPINLGEVKSIAIIGPNAAEMRVGGGGSSYVEPPYQVSPLEALRTKLGERVEIHFEQGCDSFVELPALKSEYLSPAVGQGHGLRAEYFNNVDLSGQPDMERVDPAIDFGWYFHGPDESIAIEKFSVRWTGKLAVPESGLYTLKVTNTGNCRVYLDEDLLLESSLAGEATMTNSFTWQAAEVELAGGQEYPLKVEYSKQTGEPFALVRLMMAAHYRPGEDQRIAHAAELAARSDLALVFAGMPEFYETEGADRPDLELPGPQAELIRAVAAANPRTVVVINAGSPVSIPWLEAVPAVLVAYYPGMEGGNAIVDLLLGEINPSGKLPVTFPHRLQDTPAFTNYPGGKEVHYGEGIFVGYRYYDKRQVEPLFPFGHGLSYTTFTYSDLQAPGLVKASELAGAPLQVSVQVQNTGELAGKEVVQLYVGDKESTLARPPKELKGFAKVTLQPGESQTVNFTLDQRALSFYNPYRKEWVAEPGEFEILVGSSSRDIRASATLELA